MELTKIRIGERALVTAVGGSGNLRGHLLNMGIIPGSIVKVAGRAPMGGPLELEVKGYSLSLREQEAADIEVRELLPEESERADADKIELAYSISRHDSNDHPGYGEEGKYHSKDHAHPLPKGELLTFALVGQQNCGKTTLFNRLTGSNQHVGNFPGVTVGRKDGAILGHPDTMVTDLPGIYSLSTYTQEEIVSRDFLLENRPRAIINILDASNIERNLYLTMQLMELDIPMVVALNMMDEVRKNGGAVYINILEKELGLPVIPISAARGEAIDELVDHALHVARYQEKPSRQDFCCATEKGGAIHRCLHGIMHLIDDHAQRAGLPLRFAASRLVEGDEKVASMLQLTEYESSMIQNIISVMEQERGMDRFAAMAEMRYDFIGRLCRHSVVKPAMSIERQRSNRIDKVFTGRWTALPAFVLIMAMVFYLSFDLIGGSLQGLLDTAFSSLGSVIASALASAGVSAPVCSLVSDGIFGGVGGVLSFLPIIVVLFFFLSLLEDSGYMARIAYISDSLLRKIGLSGRSIVPMLIGFGCSVPAVMSARTLPSARDRRLTIMLIPFMSCSAKLPIYGFFAAAFFPGRAAVVMFSMYLLGIAVAVLEALVSKRVHKGSEPAPFVMELPNYRLPQLKNVVMLLWEKVRDFVQKAFTTIFLATIVIWFLQSFDFSLTLVEDSSRSMLARISGFIAPLFAPMGLGDWKVVTSLFSGLLAKETVVSTMEVLGLAGSMTPLMAVPMLVFCLLYTPCVAAVNAVRAELGTRWAMRIVLIQCLLAWVFSLIAYWFALLIF